MLGLFFKSMGFDSLVWRIVELRESHIYITKNGNGGEYSEDVYREE